MSAIIFSTVQKHIVDIRDSNGKIASRLSSTTLVSSESIVGQTSIQSVSRASSGLKQKYRA